MNIFVLHHDPIIAAQMQCDKHVVKMVLESTQMLHTINSQFGLPHAYKPTHSKHPCTLWTKMSVQNWNWLYLHALALCEEYSFRYNKVHKCANHLIELNVNRPNLPSLGLTSFAQAMPVQYKDVDPVIAYRNYYMGEKHFAQWNKSRLPPSWWLYKDATK